MRTVISLMFICHICVSADSTSEISKEQWRSKIDSVLPADPDFLFSQAELQISSEETSQAQMYLMPKMDLFSNSAFNKTNSAFRNHQYGLSAQINLFQFGRSHYNYVGQNSLYEAKIIEHKIKKIQIENRYLLTLFKNTLLQKKLTLYKKIENLKRNSLRVAQQRFNRGNLPRQQVDKVEIDLNNLLSLKSGAERELLTSDLEVSKYQLGDFKREWPFADSVNPLKKARPVQDFEEVKALNLKFDGYANILESSRRNFLPQLDLQGRAYEWRLDDSRTQEWDVTLSLTWPIWDNYARSISNLIAYKDFQFWQMEKSRVLRDWEKRIQSKEEQLSKLVFQLTQSATSLKKLNLLYADTEILFSQGRITVNELFQDQQLLLETQINNENEQFAFHQFILEYCEFYSERVWDCF